MHIGHKSPSGKLIPCLCQQKTGAPDAHPLLASYTKLAINSYIWSIIVNIHINIYCVRVSARTVHISSLVELFVVVELRVLLEY